jgi:hypothetical protein
MRRARRLAIHVTPLLPFTIHIHRLVSLIPRTPLTHASLAHTCRSLSATAPTDPGTRSTSPPTIPRRCACGSPTVTRVPPRAMGGSVESSIRATAALKLSASGKACTIASAKRNIPPLFRYHLCAVATMSERERERKRERERRERENERHEREVGTSVGSMEGTAVCCNLVSVLNSNTLTRVLTVFTVTPLPPSPPPFFTTGNGPCTTRV